MKFRARFDNYRHSIPFLGKYRLVLGIDPDCPEKPYFVRIFWKRGPSWNKSRYTFRKTWRYKKIESAMRRFENCRTKFGEPHYTEILGFPTFSEPWAEVSYENPSLPATAQSGPPEAL